MNSRKITSIVVVTVTAAVFAWVPERRDPTAKARKATRASRNAVTVPPHAVSPLVATPAAAKQRAPSSPDYARPVPRGSERPVTIPTDLRSGIRCPDGSFLPLLNGVPHAGALGRDSDLSGPLPPVVAKRTEMDGTEWWIHADGSATTTRWTTLSRNGVESKAVVVDHLQPVNARGIAHLPGDSEPSGK